MIARPLNPVFSRELRQRMRSRWTPVVITIYVALLVGILQLMYSVTRTQSRDVFGPGATAVSAAGRPILHWLLVFTLVLMCFVVPGITASAIAGERERQTLVPLQVTLLRPVSILMGKLGASLAFVLLLVVASMPLLGVAFVIGGVSIGETLRGLAMTMAAGVTIAFLSLGVSTLMRRVQGATVVAYAVTLFMVAGTFVVFAAEWVATQDRQSAPRAPLVLNPFLAVSDAIGGTEGADQVGWSPLEAGRAFLRAIHRDGGVSGAEVRAVVNGVGFAGAVPPNAVVFKGQGVPVGPDGRPIQPQKSGGLHIPFWVESLATWTALCALSLVVAARRIRVPTPGGAGG